MNELKTRHSKWMSVLVVIAAVVLGFIDAFLALLMGGAGHGWGSVMISCSGVGLMPLAAVALIYRRTWGGWVLAILTLVGAGVIDYQLLVATEAEGFGYLEQVASKLPFIFIPWLILWLAWQIALTTLVFLPAFRPGRNASIRATADD